MFHRYLWITIIEDTKSEIPLCRQVAFLVYIFLLQALCWLFTVNYNLISKMFSMC